MRLVISLIFLLLASCSSGTYGWVRGGSSEQDLRMDTGQCQAQGLGATADLLRATAVFEACMQGKGWVYGPVR